MSQTDTIEILRSVLSEYTDIDDQSISLETSLTADIGLDSLDYVMFISQVEDECGISIKDKELMKLRTVGDLVACIDSKRL